MVTFGFNDVAPINRLAQTFRDNLAAGMMAASETPQTAMLRELHEEAGLNVGADTLVPLPTLSFDYQCPVPKAGCKKGRQATY